MRKLKLFLGAHMEEEIPSCLWKGWALHNRSRGGTQNHYFLSSEHLTKRRLHFQFPGPKSIWKRWLLAEPLRVISPEQEEIFRACWAIGDCNRPLASLEDQNRIQQGMSPQSLWAAQHPATEIEMSHGIRDVREPECPMAPRVSLPGLCILFNPQTLPN